MHFPAGAFFHEKNVKTYFAVCGFSRRGLFWRKNSFLKNCDIELIEKLSKPFRIVKVHLENGRNRVRQQPRKGHINIVILFIFKTPTAGTAAPVIFDSLLWK